MITYEYFDYLKVLLLYISFIYYKILMKITDAFDIVDKNKFN